MKRRIPSLAIIGLLELKDPINGVVKGIGQGDKLLSCGVSLGAHHNGELVPGELGEQGDNRVGDLGGGGRGAGEGRVESLVRHLVVGTFLKARKGDL